MPPTVTFTHSPTAARRPAAHRRAGGLFALALVLLGLMPALPADAAHGWAGGGATILATADGGGRRRSGRA